MITKPVCGQTLCDILGLQRWGRQSFLGWWGDRCGKMHSAHSAQCRDKAQARCAVPISAAEVWRGLLLEVMHESRTGG